MPPYFPVHAGAWFSAPTCLQKFLPFSKTGELAISNLRFRPISPAKASCGAGKQELKRGLTRYRPTAPDSFVWGELHGSRQPYQRGVPRLPAALFKGQNFEQKKSSPFSRKTLILAGLQGFEPWNDGVRVRIIKPDFPWNSRHFDIIYT